MRANDAALQFAAQHEQLLIEGLVLYLQVYPDGVIERRLMQLHNDDCDPILLRAPANSGTQLFVNQRLSIDSAGYQTYLLPDRTTTKMEWRTFATTDKSNTNEAAETAAAKPEKYRLQLMVQLMDTLKLSDLASLQSSGLPLSEGKLELLYSEEKKLFQQSFEILPEQGWPRIALQLSNGMQGSKAANGISRETTDLPSIGGVVYRQVSFDENGIQQNNLASSVAIWTTVLLSFGGILLCIGIGWLLIRKVFGGK